MVDEAAVERFVTELYRMSDSGKTSVLREEFRLHLRWSKLQFKEVADECEYRGLVRLLAVQGGLDQVMLTSDGCQLAEALTEDK